jgi:GWxTD domain-containing protein
MNTLFAYSLIHALGWTLLHFCWQGVIVAAVVWCGLRLIDGGSARARYGVACGGLVLMVALPMATFAHLASEPRPVAFEAPVLRMEWSAVPAGGGSPSAEPWRARVARGLDDAAPWLPAVWLAGVVLFLGRLSLGLMVTRRMKSAGALAAPAELQGVFRELAGRLGVARAVRLAHSALVQVPTVVGWLRPVVLLPVGCFLGLSAVQVEALLAHELAHIRRHDYLVSVFQSVVEALLFYHPAVWWVSKQVRRERECCCDDLAVRIGGDPLAYAKALSLLEGRRSFLPEVALGANGGVLTMRIKRLLGTKESPAVSQLAAVAVLTIVVAAVGVGIGAVARAQARAGHTVPVVPEMALVAPAVLDAELVAPALGSGKDVAPAAVGAEIVPPAGSDAAGSGGPEAQTGPLTGVYRTWLDQDVLWIINPEERAAFSRLSNDEERDRFIRQFWARRNPPGAAADSYREEQYGRIAYANENFATDKQPGWKTDRGHIYIVYGKPDEIDAHSAGGGGTAYPFQTWRYRSIPGVGENVDMKFVDTCRCGEYNYTVDGMNAPLGVKMLAAPGPAQALGPPIVKPMLFTIKADSLVYDFSQADSPHATSSGSDPKQSAGKPDMACTYYDAASKAHAGSCEENSAADKGHYSCRADDDKKLVEAQSGCEWKVKRLEEWEHSQGQHAAVSSEFTGPKIARIEYKGLNSITIADVRERFDKTGVGPTLESQYDPTQIARAVMVLRVLLSEHGHSSATIMPVVKAIAPGTVGITFDVKEGPGRKASSGD